MLLVTILVSKIVTKVSFLYLVYTANYQLFASKQAQKQMRANNLDL